MPLRALRLATRYSLLGMLLMAAATAVALRAADATEGMSGTSETFTQIAERFGLWAAMCVLLVIASVYALYQQSLFIHRTMVDLVRANQRCIDRNTDALRDAPCGLASARDQDRDPAVLPGQ